MSDILERLGEQANMRGLAGVVEIDAYDEIKRLRAENARLLAALKLLVSDVADYPAWQRPCHALDVARELIADLTEAPR